MLSWAREHGSERLRLMIEMDAGDIIEAAEREFVDASAPAGYTREAYAAYEDCEPRHSPQLGELRALRDARALVSADGPIIAARLMRATAEGETDDDDDPGESVHYPVVELDIRTPNGKEYTVARALATHPA